MKEIAPLLPMTVIVFRMQIYKAVLEELLFCGVWSHFLVSLHISPKTPYYFPQKHQ
jgi:hypothetical protein